MIQASEQIASQFADANYAKRLWGGFINVKVHGAKGDGVTDDSASIQAALNSVTTRGAIVLFPEGIYYLSRDVVTNDKEFNFIMAPSARFIGTGKMPLLINVNHQAQSNYMVSTPGAEVGGWETGYQTFAAEVIPKLGYTGNPVAGYFAARSIPGQTATVWGTNIVADLYPGCLGDGIGEEIDINNSGIEYMGRGILINGIGDKKTDAGIHIKKEYTSANNGTGIRIECSEVGVDIHGDHVNSPIAGMKIQNYPKDLIVLSPKSNASFFDNVMYGLNPEGDVAWKITNGGQGTFNDGIQIGNSVTKITNIFHVNSPVINLGSIPAHSTVDYDVPLSGARAGDDVRCTTTGLQGGLMWLCYVASNDLVKVRIANVTTAAITPFAHQMSISLTSYQ